MAESDAMRTCTFCHDAKPITEFFAKKTGSISGRCKACFGRVERKCEECHSVFFGFRKAKFCTSDCRWKSERRQNPKKPRNAWSRERVCADCGKIETVRKDNKATICLSCRGRRGVAVALPTITAKKPWAKCLHCGNIIRRNRWQLERLKGNGPYCSIACANAARRVDRICKQCGRSFTVGKGRLGENTNSSGNFCCRPCYSQWLSKPDREQVRGSRWLGIRTQVTKRTPYCVVCGQRHKLQVHHIVPYRLTADNDISNLVVLCKKHHTEAELQFRAIERTYVGSWSDLKCELASEFRIMQSTTRSRLGLSIGTPTIRRQRRPMASKPNRSLAGSQTGPVRSQLAFAFAASS